MINKKSTRTKTTDKQYDKRCQQLFTRYQKETNNPKEVDFPSFLDWLISIKPTIKKPTWNQYKSAVLSKLDNTQCFESPQCKKQYEKLKNITSEGCLVNKTVKSTSSLKSKSLNRKDEDKLLNALNDIAKSSYWAERALIYLKATILTGLRPCEWAGAKFVPHFDNEKGEVEPALVVENAKNTNGRTHGDERHLLLGTYDVINLRMITLQVSLVNERKDKKGDTISFDSYQKSCTKRIADTSVRLFAKRKKRPSLYTARHQFSSNLKSNGYSLTEIAALMGHKTDDTATVHYGRKSSKKGHGEKPDQSNLPTALPSEVARIEQVYEQRSKNAPHNKKNKGPSLR